MAKIRGLKFTKSKGRSFPGLAGRPGQVGGSVPREAGAVGAALASSLNKKGWATTVGKGGKVTAKATITKEVPKPLAKQLGKTHTLTFSHMPGSKVTTVRHHKVDRKFEISKSRWGDAWPPSPGVVLYELGFELR